MANIYYGEQKIGTINNKRSFKSKVKGFFKKVVFWSIVILAFAGAVKYFNWAYPTIIEKEVVKEVIINQEIKYPILDKIALCESNNKHFDTNGQVLVRGNAGNRASVDIGRYQLNAMYHGKKATEMGLNLFNEQDNRTYAVYLFETQGTEPWSASKKCWAK
jgi:hypothetical protein